MREHHKESRGRIALGVILILLGAIFITDKFDLLSFEIHDYIFHWPVILIIIGIVFLINSKDNFAGVLLILVGSIVMLVAASAVVDNYESSLGQLSRAIDKDAEAD